ncbi:hypothetical protein AF71_00026770 [Rhizobium sp. 57MFTsu3.2]|nr:hypothetical protein [Rhizobium sp. 57MFTsu3.2]
MTPTFLFGLTASLLVIATIGHFLPGEAPDEFAAAVVAF